MSDWELKDNVCRGWVLHFSDRGIPPVFPRYRGAFEEGETAPRRICVNSLKVDGGAASVRFRAPSLPRRHRSFGVSVEVPPEIWTPAGSRRGWHFFSTDTLVLGICSSLPATWLAQNPDGSLLQPPWRELWTFGSSHVWTCRISRTGAGMDAFISECCSRPVRHPPRRGGIIHDSVTLESGALK